MTPPQDDLLVRFLIEYPSQPATAWWRAIEVGHLIDAAVVPDGLGLDLGCGDGRLTRLIDELLGGRQWVGVDPDPHEVELAKAEDLYTRLHVAAGDGVPEADATFDFVLSNSVLEHIPDLEPVVADAARLLRPGGAFVFTVPSSDFHACLAGPGPLGDRERYLRRLDARVAHRHYLTLDEWKAMLGRHGLEVDHATSYLTAPEVQRWETLASMTSGVLYRLTGGGVQPIQLQRSLGLRRGARLPTTVARAEARMLRTGVRTTDGPSLHYGGLLVRARRVAGG